MISLPLSPLATHGIFCGALDSHTAKINNPMLVAAAKAIAAHESGVVTLRE